MMKQRWTNGICKTYMGEGILTAMVTHCAKVISSIWPTKRTPEQTELKSGMETCELNADTSGELATPLTPYGKYWRLRTVAVAVLGHSELLARQGWRCWHANGQRHARKGGAAPVKVVPPETQQKIAIKDKRKPITLYLNIAIQLPRLIKTQNQVDASMEV